MDQNPAPAAPATPQNTKQQIVDSLKNATNVLVTVSENPSVDQLAACIGFTLLLNKLDKHTTAVFSGQVPSTIEFLQPEKTLEQNTDSLRDFIISLDRSKADKLRYKIEDNVVKIFITPYRTSLSEADLQYSQGDFNVDVVVALGVDQREHLDQAITAHGRILHDAAVIGISCGAVPTDVGTVNWHDPQASSLSEMLVSISEAFQSGLLDSQMATAFLTGIVAETARFSNEKTTPKVMTMSAQLMAAGANQQLISTQLTVAPAPEVPIAVKSEEESQEPKEFDVPKAGEEPAEPTTSEPISLHQQETSSGPTSLSAPAPAVEPEASGRPEDDLEQIHIDKAGRIHEAPLNLNVDSSTVPPPSPPASSMPLMRGHEKVIKPLPPAPETTNKPTNSGYIYEPPKTGGTFTASTMDDARNEVPAPGFAPPNNTSAPLMTHEPMVPPSVTEQPVASEDTARQAVVDAVSSSDYKPIANSPAEALNAQPINLDNDEPPTSLPPSNSFIPAPPPVPPPLPMTPNGQNGNGQNPPEFKLPT